jgi:hypothetical protein
MAGFFDFDSRAFGGPRSRSVWTSFCTEAHLIFWRRFARANPTLFQAYNRAVFARSFTVVRNSPAATFFLAFDDFNGLRVRNAVSGTGIETGARDAREKPS